MNYVLKKTNVLAKPQCLTHIGERAIAHCSSLDTFIFRNIWNKYVMELYQIVSDLISSRCDQV